MENSDSLKNVAQIQRIRRILVTILCISWIVHIGWLISGNVNLFNINDPRIAIIVHILFNCFYGANIGAVCRCDSWLRVYARLHAIYVGLSAGFLISTTITLVIETTYNVSQSNSLYLAVTNRILGVFYIVCEIIVIIYHVKLVRLVDVTPDEQDQDQDPAFCICEMKCFN